MNLLIFLVGFTVLKHTSQYKKVFFLVFLIIITFRLSSQSIIIQVGDNYMFSKTKVPILNQTSALTNHEYFSISYDDIIQVSKLFNISLSYENFNGWTGFMLEDENNYYGAGESSVVLHRLNTVIAYDIIQNIDKISINPNLGLYFEYSQKTWDDYSFSGSFNNEQAPDYIGDRYLEIFGRFQVLPGIGINIQWNPFWRLVFKLDYHFTYGYKPFQKLYQFYEHKGIQQPTAKWYSDGTAHFIGVGIGFRLFREELK